MRIIQASSDVQPRADNIHPSGVNYSVKRASSRPHSTTGLHKFIRLLPIISLLLGFLFLRTYRIDEVFPYFVDELRHIERGRTVWSFQDLRISTTPGKFLLYYWLGLFDLPRHEPGWISRTAVALFSMLGAAGTFALARQLFDRRVALLALVLLVGLPFMMFYERLALSDPLAASTTVLVAWWSLVFARNPRPKHGLILGLLVSGMLAAKILSAPLVILPGVAIFLFSPHWQFEQNRPIRPQIRQFINIYGRGTLYAMAITGLIWGVLILLYVLRGVIAPDQTAPIVDRYLYEGVRRTTGASQVATPWELWYTNWWRFEQILYYMWGPILILLGLISAWFMYHRYPRQALFLGIAPLIIWGLVIFSAGQLTTRYTILPGHLAIIVLSAGIWSLQEVLRQHLRQTWLAQAPLLAVVIWGISFSTPFYANLVQEPQSLDIPERDEWEYFSNQTGYGLRDALLDIAEMPAISEGSDLPIVFGMVRNCSFLPSHIPAETPIQILCTEEGDDWARTDYPDRHLSIRKIEQLARRYDRYYLILEELEHNSLLSKWEVDVQFQYITTYERPFDGVDVNLYIVWPRQPLPSKFQEADTRPVPLPFIPFDIVR
jgi:4-amino-4-deoxy-L-arabinose transferase-like glycosyltransferase